MKKIQGVLLACALSAAAPAGAVDFPTHPITLILPLAAGSTADILARAIQPGLSQALGQSVIVENKPGAGGQIAMSYVAKSAPDGHTLVMGTNNTWAINLGLFKKLSYDPFKDFTPVAYLAGSTNVLIVSPDSPYDSVKSLIAGLRAEPGKLTFSSGGNGTSHQLSAELLKSMTHTSAEHIPYKGAAEGVSAVIGKQVTFGFYNTPSVSGLVKDGRLRALATTGKARSPLLPQTPTMIEAGVPGYLISVDFGLMAPAGTPADVVDKINAAARKVMKAPDLRKKLTGLGYEVFMDDTPAQFGAFIDADVKKWLPLVKQSGAHVD